MRKTMILGVLAACLVWAPPYIPPPERIQQAIAAAFFWATSAIVHTIAKVLP